MRDRLDAPIAVDDDQPHSPLNRIKASSSSPSVGGMFDEDWAAIVSGGARPRVGEVFWLALFSTREWVTVAVTEVIDGRPGHWRVRKRFLGGDEERRPMRPMCVTGVVAATHQAAA